MSIQRVIGRATPLGIVVAALTTSACHRASPSAVGSVPAAAVTTPPAFSVDALFTAATFRLDGKKVVTEYGEDGTSESERHWLIDCRQTPIDAPPPRRIAELDCEAAPVPDEDGGTSGQPFDIELDGYWVATDVGLWQVVDLDDALEPIAVQLTLPPVARHDEVPEPAGEGEDPDQGAREVYETTRNDQGAWCHRELSDPGGGAEASYWSWCFDSRGLVSGTAGDGHGATTWESSFTRRAP